MTGHRGGWESICGEIVMPQFFGQLMMMDCRVQRLIVAFTLHLSLYLYRQSTVRDGHLKCNYGDEGRVDGVTRDQ